MRKFCRLILTFIMGCCVSKEWFHGPDVIVVFLPCVVRLGHRREVAWLTIYQRKVPKHCVPVGDCEGM